MNSFLFWFHVVVVQICRFKICMRLLCQKRCAYSFYVRTFLVLFVFCERDREREYDKVHCFCLYVVFDVYMFCMVNVLKSDSLTYSFYVRFNDFFCF